MKRILIVDPLSYSGHVNYNHGIIRAISQNFDYGIIVNEYTADNLKKKGIEDKRFIFVYPNKWSIESLCKLMRKVSYHIASRLFFLRVVLRALRLSHDYDAIIFTSIDVFAFTLVSWLFKKQTLVVDHGIGEVDVNPMYRLSWRLIKNSIILIVMEDFILEMVNRTLPQRMTVVVKHPLPETRKLIQNKKKEKCCSVFAPSASNSEVFLEQLLDWKIPDGIKIFAKSRTIEYISDHLHIYNKYMSVEDYQNHLNEADYILLAYEASYNYRISAVLFESINIGKPVLLLNNNTLSNYSSIFKNVMLFKNCEELFDILSNRRSDIISESGINAYSDEMLAQSLKEALSS